MRALWLASAAFIASTTLACAQTMTAAPAPNGAATAPVQTTQGMSPGKSAPPSSADAGQAPMSPVMSQSSMSSDTTAPAPNGATNAPAMTAPGASPGKTAPSQEASMDNSSNMMNHPMHGMDSSGLGGPMPDDASAMRYLHIAKFAIRHNDKARADDALSRAETRLLTRAVPQSATIPTDDSPAVTGIEQARQALRSGDWHEASADIDMAMHNMHHGMMSNMSASTSSSE
jgi:hypothetical protein